MSFNPIKTGKELKAARVKRGLSQEDLEEETGVSQTAIGDIELGKRKKLGPQAIQLLRFFGHAVPALGIEEHIDSAEVAAGFGTVSDRFGGAIKELETRAGMGGGGIVSIEHKAGNLAADPVKPDRWQFPPGFIRNELRAAPQGVIIAETQGDSMVPTLHPGDRVVIDTNHRRPSPDGVYALRDQFGGLIVKRLHTLAKRGLFSVISDNPAHPPREVKGRDLEGEIIGRVVGAVKRL